MKSHGSVELNRTADLSPRHRFFDPSCGVHGCNLHHHALFNAGRHQESEGLLGEGGSDSGRCVKIKKKKVLPNVKQHGFLHVLL